MKKSIYIIIAMVAIALTSCDKKDCNGDLDGMWQLIEWRDKDNNVKATKEDMIFYSFQLQMASFRKVGEGGNSLYESMLEASPTKIRIYNPMVYGGDGHDKILPMSRLSKLGVPDNGIFLIQVLTGSKMQLKTSDEETLVFRKY